MTANESATHSHYSLADGLTDIERSSLETRGIDETERAICTHSRRRCWRTEGDSALRSVTQNLVAHDY